MLGGRFGRHDSLLGISPNQYRQHAGIRRGARAIDHVCVSLADRDRTARENASGVWQACTQGFVWRVAYPGDYRCVIHSSRSANRVDNANAPYRLAWVIMSRWPHNLPPTNCQDGVCCATNQSEYYTAGVRGYYPTPGAQVTIQIMNDATQQKLRSGRAGGKGPGGTYDIDTGNLLCQGGTYNAFVQVREKAAPGHRASPSPTAAATTCEIPARPRTTRQGNPAPRKLAVRVRDHARTSPRSELLLHQLGRLVLHPGLPDPS
ncbi:hypothetical protein AB0K48_01915 [Nonomuraea sp. NPDC055795]